MIGRNQSRAQELLSVLICSVRMEGLWLVLMCSGRVEASFRDADLRVLQCNTMKVEKEQALIETWLNFVKLLYQPSDEICPEWCSIRLPITYKSKENNLRF